MMFQSPSSTSSIITRGSNESKKRKSFTNIPDDQSTASSTESRRTNASLAIERNTASPVTSEGSITTRFVINNESLSPNKDIPCVKEVLIAAALEQPDSDVATEDGSNTTKEAMSSVLGSPTARLDDIIPRNDGSNKKPRFSEDVHSPILSRQRSYTFSTAHEYNKQPSLPKSAFDPLAWLASIAEREHEVDAAKSLFSLSHDASQDLVEGEEVDEDEEDDQENEASREIEGENDDDEYETQYVDPYLTTHNGHSRSVNSMELNESEFSAISYLQSFQEKAKQWKSNPFDGNTSGKVLDPLELLTTSADLVASPMSKRTLNLSASFKEGLKEMSLLPFPNSARFNQNSSSSNNSHGGLINFSDSNEVHYLDTMNIDLQNISHTSKVTGRARSASMSLIEGYSSLSNSNQFDNPALARIKESFGKKQGIPIPPKGEGYIGIYSPEERKIRIQRFLEKRKHRMWAKKVKYDVRKNFADSRIRVKGRFVKKEEEKAAMILMQNK